MKRYRCKDCGHTPKRVVSSTRKTEGKDPLLVVPKLHKKPCHCDCHRAEATP